MKHKLDDILNTANEEELSLLLDGTEFPKEADLEAKIREKTLSGLGLGKTREASPRPRLRKKTVLFLAACIAVLAALGVGTYAFAAEAKEYNTAKEFFMENGLSADGLTRTQIKAVYRDITTESFTYGKTAEVIAHGLYTSSIPGYELSFDLRSREEVEAAWQELRNNWLQSGSTGLWSGEELASKSGYYSEMVFSDDGKLNVLATVIERKDGDKTLWSTRVDGLSSYRLKAVTGGVIAYGSVSDVSGKPLIVKVSENGTVLWRREAYNDCGWFDIRAVAELKNGDLAAVGLQVITPGEDPVRDLCYARYSAEGELLQMNTRRIGGEDPRLAVPFGDGCLVALYGGKILNISEDGSFSESAAYSEEDREYSVVSMTEYDGSLYLSCYSYPKPTEEYGWPYYELTGVRFNATFEEIFDWFDTHTGEETANGYSDAVFMESLRENYKAILLKIDPDSPEPEVFYSVDGAFGSRLDCGAEGDLIWHVENISSAGFLMLNSHSYEILCSVTRCRFDRSGALTATEDTGEISKIWK